VGLVKGLSAWKAFLAIFAAVAFIGYGISVFANNNARVATQRCAGITLVVNDSTKAQCARLAAKDVELKALKRAAKAMNGQLVAGTKVTIKRDTITKTITEVVTVTDSLGNRSAAVHDTTDDYRVDIQAAAPRSGALKIGYQIVTPERSIEVGFVKRADGYYAVASGKGVRTTESFFQPEQERPVSLVAGGSVRGAPSASLVGAKLGLEAYGAVQYAKNGTAYQLRLGHDGSPYVGLAIQKKLW
jgi:hypothetical protein